MDFAKFSGQTACIPKQFWRNSVEALQERSHPFLELVRAIGKPVQMNDFLLQSAPELLDRGRLSGWQFRKGVREALHKASLFVFPSRHEGFGLVLVEAMAAGCSIVASDVGGIPEVAADACARLVPPDDPDALAEVIGASLTDPGWQEEAATVSMRRASQFDWETVIDEYERCL